jgi:hypothetical protein
MWLRRIERLGFVALLIGANVALGRLAYDYATGRENGTFNSDLVLDLTLLGLAFLLDGRTRRSERKRPSGDRVATDPLVPADLAHVMALPLSTAEDVRPGTKETNRPRL